MRKPLSIDSPAVAAEWDYELNAPLMPDEFTGGSEYVAWWKCRKCGNRWQAKIYSRTEGRGCRICARDRLKPGINDLATLAPGVAAEWDYFQNEPHIPSDFTADSTARVWWACSRGHSWQAKINKRTKRNQGCPYCGNNKVWQGYNDLATTHPRIAEEWHPRRNGKLRPEGFTFGADEKVWWLCAKCRHEWQAFIYSRTNDKSGTGCPSCAGNTLVVGKNDLLTVNSALAAQWDYKNNNGVRPENVAANDNDKYFWICEKRHSWCATVASRNAGKGCPYCTNRLVLPGFNDLLTIDPALAAEWDYDGNAPLRPEDVVADTHDIVMWRCARGHSWPAQVANRRRGTECPYCSGKLAIPGETDLETLRPDLVAQWDYEKNMEHTPDSVTAQAHWIVFWKCERGHSYKAAIHNRYRGRGCPYCAGKLPIVGETDFASVHPELLGEWDHERNANKNPQQFTYGSRKRVWWKCSEGHRWKSSFADRHAGHGCPVCAKLKDKHIVTVGVNDLMTVHPYIAAQWDYGVNKELTPQQVLPQSNREVGWVCALGHHWLATVQARTLGKDCPHCFGKTPLRTRLV